MFNLPFLRKYRPTIKPIVLLVLDGFGVAPPSRGNAISLAKIPNLKRFESLYPHGELIASGESVGLPANEAGNSEVGHLTIGAGRVIYQSLTKIDMAIEDGSFFENNAFISAVNHVRKNNSRLHLMGLVSSGTVHSSIKHFYALLDFCSKQEVNNVAIHLFTDGRDAPPKDGINVIRKIEGELENIKLGQIATVMGRYYAMDRDGRWERTQRAYEAIVMGKGLVASSAVEALSTSYQKGITDEFIEPTIIQKDPSFKGTVEDGDSLIFFNFRIDRPRQLTMAFIIPNFESLKTVEFGYVPHEGTFQKRETSGPTFKREKKLQGLFFVSMTEYQKNLPVSAIAFPSEEIVSSLPEVISKANLLQMHLAESEKERMVSFYFDGLREERFPGEEVVIIVSPRVATYDKKPEMSVFKLVSRFKKELRRDKYHFFLLNFANPDMVAHSGNLEATKIAIEAVDKATGELVEAVYKAEGVVIITADHGNAEELWTFPSTSYFVTTSSGEINTEHSNNPVPIYIIGKKFEARNLDLGRGTLADVAPTILALMGIQKPAEMTGRNLLGESMQEDQRTSASLPEQEKEGTNPVLSLNNSV